jgi:hypothetical protein
MKNSTAIAVVLFWAVAWLWGCQTKPAFQGAGGQSVLQRGETADDVTVRFYYNPGPDDISPGPLILLPASSQDPRLGTRPGWILYLTLSDLRSVLRVLERSELKWKESGAAKQLVVDPFQLPHLDRGTMEISVSYPRGSATAELELKQACPLLSDVYNSVSDSKSRSSLSPWVGSCVVKPQ